MKKFVIQWRKFESKRSSRNEVMNFFGIFLIFQEFLAFKNHKKGVYMC